MLHKPYSNDATNLIYNMLFCDEPDQFRKGLEDDDWYKAIWAKEHDHDQLLMLAKDGALESRIRALAYQRLFREGLDDPRHYLLGAIVEMPLEGGLETLAAYTDERVRYINQNESMVVLEPAIGDLAAKVQAWMRISQHAVRQFGPWEHPRLPPPKLGNVRLSFVVSDGLYFAEGAAGDIAADPLASQILNAATDVLMGCVDLALATKK